MNSILVHKKIKCDIVTFENNENSNLLDVKLKIVHNGVNENNTNLSLDSIKEAEPTIKPVPILGFIKYDDDNNPIDFDSHNMEIKEVKDKEGNVTYKIDYLEKMIGYIPKDTEITYEEEDGKTYMYATGHIFKTYADDACYLLENSDKKSVSMEICAEEVEVLDNDCLDIKKFQFLGVTILGDDVLPGINGAEVTKIQTFSKYKEEIESICSKAQEKVKEEKALDNSKENAKEDFSFSYENIFDSLAKQLKSRTVQREDYWGGTFEGVEFYLRTIVPEDNIAIVEDGASYYTYYGIPYKISGDDYVLDYESKKEYISVWREKDEGESINFEKYEDPIKEIVLNRFAEKDREIQTLNSDLEKLKEFKEKKDLEEQKEKVKEVLDEFDELDQSSEEVKSLKKSAEDGDITLSDLRKELKALGYEKFKAQFSKKKQSKDEKDDESKIDFSAKIEEEIKDTKSYDAILNKYCK
nr:hypothetical protein [Clostridioides sp.]